MRCQKIFFAKIITNLVEKIKKGTSQKGFTLIELLFGISILAILFSVGYANYRDFQKRQTLEAVARTLISDLRSIQESALAGKKPQNCADETLNYYYFGMVNFSRYSLGVSCGNSNFKNIQLKVNDLSNDFRLEFVPSSPNCNGIQDRICFYPLGKGTSLVNNLQITITFMNSITKTVTITPAGSIF